MTYTGPFVSNQVSYQTKDCSSVSLCDPVFFCFVFRPFVFIFVFSSLTAQSDTTAICKCEHDPSQKNGLMCLFPATKATALASMCDNGCEVVKASGEMESLLLRASSLSVVHEWR
ncbi:unnamed protein product [Boreogadus saida]